MRDLLRKLIKDEEGATAVEYGLIVAAIAAVIILTVIGLGQAVEGTFATTRDGINTAAGS
ncbi:Flp family type IVb pilin [Myxococcota bacterium]